MALKVRESWDLVVIIFLSGLFLVVFLVLPDSPLRTVLALPFLFFFPGYSLAALLFAEADGIGNVERIVLSFALSLMVTSLIGFGLNYTPFGIRLESVLASMTLFNLAFSLLSFWRRNKIPSPFVPFSPVEAWNSFSGTLRKDGKVDRFLTIVLILAVVSSVAALAFVVAAPRAGQNFTEFYVLGPGGRAIGYPQNLTVGQSAFVVLGITNHENRQVAYFVQTWLVNATLVNNNTVIKDMFFFNQWSAVLDSTASNLEGPSVLQFEKDYHFSVNATGQYKLWFFLFKDSVPSYAQNLTPMQNYTGGPTDQLLDYAVDGNTTVLTALSLNLLVKSP